MKSTLIFFLTKMIVLAQLVAAPGAVLAEAAGEIRPAVTARSTLQVEGMVGEACPVLITSALGRVEGVRHVEASYDTHSATVDYDAAQVSLEQIRDTILRQAGFRTRVRD
jgi:copper chaperone CopZ